MTRSRTLAALVSVVVGAMVSPAGVLAAGSAPGNYQSLISVASVFSSSGGDTISIQAGMNTTGSPSTTTSTTTVSLDASGSVNGTGCYAISPSDFSFSLTAASLHTVITDSRPACGGFPGNTFTPPFTIDVTWTSTGQIRDSRLDSVSTCATFRDEISDVHISNAATAVATVSLFGPTFSSAGGLNTENITNHVKGSELASCPLGGRPDNWWVPFSQQAGEYHSSLNDAQFQRFNGTDPAVDLVVSMSSIDTELHIDIFGNAIFGRGCFVLSPSDISFSGVQSAVLNVTLTDATPQCGRGGSNLPLPQAVNVLWTGSGPLSTLIGQASVSCPGYMTQSQVNIASNAATATATISPLLPDPVTASQDFNPPGTVIESYDTHTHTTGVPCH